MNSENKGKSILRCWFIIILCYVFNRQEIGRVPLTCPADKDGLDRNQVYDLCNTVAFYVMIHFKLWWRTHEVVVVLFKKAPNLPDF